MNYHVNIYNNTGKLAYFRRQREANRIGAICYVEQHFNSGSDSADYGMVLTAPKPSAMTLALATAYTAALRRSCKIGLFYGPVPEAPGVLPGGFNGRGMGNLRWLKIPGILVEPIFVSNAVQARWLKVEGVPLLARTLNIAIRKTFPDGGIVAFSVGHVPPDPGAKIVNGGWEHDWAIKVLKTAKVLLEDA